MKIKEYRRNLNEYYNNLNDKGRSLFNLGCSWPVLFSALSLFHSYSTPGNMYGSYGFLGIGMLGLPHLLFPKLEPERFTKKSIDLAVSE